MTINSLWWGKKGMSERLTKMIYVASPYSSYHWCPLVRWYIRWQRYRQVTVIIGQLQDKYPYAFIGPITQSHQTAKYMGVKCGLFKSWQRRDLTYISRCDEVWVVKLPGWALSIGVLSEIAYAKTIYKMKVRYLDPITLRKK